MSTLTIEEQAAPSTPGANKVVVYALADGLLYAKDDVGTQRIITVSSMTSSLGADVNLSTTAAYFDGPSIAQGSIGIWFASGTVAVNDTGVPAAIYAKLWDGSTVISSAGTTVGGIGQRSSISLSGFIASPAGNLRISCRDVTAATGVIKFNETGNSKDSTITAIRIG